MSGPAHVHAVECMPQDRRGWATCACGATLRIEDGRPVGVWHACDLCAPEWKQALADDLKPLAADAALEATR